MLIHQTAAQVIIGNQKTYSLDGQGYLLIEKKPLTIEEAWKAFQQNDFYPIFTPDNNLDSGFAPSVYWLALSVKNTSATSQNLEAGIDNGGIFDVRFYALTDNGSVLHRYITGTHYTFSTRPLQSRHFFFPLQLLPNESALLFFRIDMRGDALHLPLRLEKAGYNKASEARLPLFYACYCGALAFVTLFGLIAFAGTRNKVYLFYALYVASYCLAFLGNSNLDVVWLYPNVPALATLSPAIYGFSLCVFMLLFMIHYLELKESHPKLFLLAMAWIALLTVIASLLVIGYLWLENMALRWFVFHAGIAAIFGAMCLQIWFIIVRIRDKCKPAYYYGLASTFVVLVFLFYVLKVLNVISEFIPAYVYLPVGFGLEILIISFALIYSYNFYKDQHQQLSISLAQEKLHFSNRLIQIQQAEQNRIAQDLHDELGGNLAAIKMNLQSLKIEDEKAARSMIQLIDSASDNARHIAHNLMPPEFEKTPLSELLTTFFNRLNKEDKIGFHFYTNGINHHFTKQQDLVIYRIIMELTNNIIKHSCATEATIQLIYSDTYLEIMSEDNGKGIATSTTNGMGMDNIHSRVNYLGGEINIDSGSKGTTIIIRLPYPSS